MLQCMYSFCIEHGYIINNNCVLCNDVIMIEKDKYEEELFIKFNEIIKEKMNFDLQFTVNELNQGYTKEQLIDHQIKSELSGIFTDVEAAKKLYKLYPYFICCNDELYAFNDKMGMYIIDENINIYYK